MTDFRSTNDKIAELLDLQTYDERIDLAEFLASSASEWVNGGEKLDQHYFAGLLGQWVSEQADDAEAQS